MLNKLHIKNLYVHKDKTIEFKSGLTRIYGANEAGKSLVFESIRFALFGNGALRGSTSDYKGVEVTLDFTVAGTEYKVHRTTGNATLHRGKELIVRATKPVNNKIIGLLGYGLKTFDSVNAITQGDVEKLTKLTGPERKKFLDELIGVAEIDKLVLDYKSELDIANSELKAFTSVLVTTVKPEPVGYKSEDIQSAIDAFNAKIAEGEAKTRALKELQRQHDRIIVLPDPLPDTDAEQLDALSEELEALDQQIVRLYKAGITDYVLLNTVAQQLAELDKIVAPKLTQRQIEDAYEKIEQNNAWLEVQKLRELLETYQSCPRCGLSFEAEAEATSAQINALLNKARPHRNLPSVEYLKEQDALYLDYAERLDKQSDLDEKYVQAVRTLGGSVQFTQRQFDDVISFLTSNPTLDAKTLNASRRAKTEAVQKLQLANQIDQVVLDDVEGLSHERDQLINRRRLAIEYETQLRYFEEAEARNAKTQAKIEKSKAEAEEILRVIKALQGFKYYVNTYFLPAVSKAASSMLTTMTNGRYRLIHISDKFEIMVGGQSVETMSGSTKAIVNISLRLALQFVLTKNTFSVFMGDEIDASFDDDRVDHLAECLSAMKKYLTQIIVISHRQLKADHDIKL